MGDRRIAATLIPGEDFFGRASYHLFIGHMPIATVLVTGLKLRQSGVSVFVAAVISALALSTLLVPMERNINVLRQRIAKIRKKRIEAAAVPAKRL